MKKAVILRTWIALASLSGVTLISQDTMAQTDYAVFYPAVVTFPPGSIGSTFTVTTFIDFGLYGPYSDAGVSLVGSEGVTSIPNWVGGDKYGNGAASLTITVHVDNSGCFNGTLTAVAHFPDWTEDSIGTCSIGGYVYDPETIGTVHLNNDTLNFGSVPVGVDDDIFQTVAIDTPGGISLELQMLNVIIPFTPPDSVQSTTGYCGLAPNIVNYGGNFHFHPSELKKYVDTAFIYDRIRKDSTTLILIGEGVAAGVSKSTIEGEAFQIYPNPCNQFANVVLSGGALEQVVIRNMLGATVQTYHTTNSDFRLDATSLSDGVYLVEARSDGATITKLLVVFH